MKLAPQILFSSLFGLAFFGIALFLPAWTFDYWQAWVFIAVFSVIGLVSSIYLAVGNPDALRRRMRAGPTNETRPVQQIVISGTVLMVLATLVVSALDHRFGWSSVPVGVVVTGIVLVAVGLTLAQLVVIQNGYAGANIVVEDGQPLVSTGLYGVVRHPMYSGVGIMMVGTPPALGSYWGLLAVVAILPLLAVRILDEEMMLTADLAGYREYRTRVRYRVIPYVW